MKNRIFKILLLIIVTFGVYANSINNEFVWDDTHLIVNNPHIKNVNFIPKLFASDLYQNASRGDNIYYYRPMQMLSYMMDYFLWGLDARQYHVTNIFLHILNVLFVFIIAKELAGSELIAMASGLLFAVHPVHVAAVTYIAGRADLLMVLFLLFSFLVFIRNFKPGRPLKRLLSLSLLSFVFAVLSKETALIFPFILLAYLFIFYRRDRDQEERGRAFIYSLPFFIISFVYALFRFLKLGFIRKAMITSDGSMVTALLNAPKIIVEYFKLLFVPFNLHMEREVAFQSFLTVGYLAPLIILIVVIWTLIKNARKYPGALFGLAWFFIALIPVLNVFRINATVAEHWLYLPSIGLFISFSEGVFRSQRLKNVKIILMIFVLFFLSVLTFRQNTYWQNEETLYERTLWFAPNSARVNTNLSIVYLKQGKIDKALEKIEQSISIKPNDPVSHKILGNIYYKQKLFVKAYDEYKISIALDPQYAPSYLNLGALYFHQGLYDDAQKMFKKVIALNPASSQGHYNLGMVFNKRGDEEQAFIHINKALDLSPDNQDALFFLMHYYEKHRSSEELVEVYNRLVNMPIEGKAVIHSKLALIYDMAGDYKLALREFKNAVSNDHENAEYYNNIGVLYAKLRFFDKARQSWQQALDVDAEYEEAKNNLNKLNIGTNVSK